MTDSLYHYQRPDDFEAFWISTLVELERTPTHLVLERSERYSNDEADVSHVRLQSLHGVTLRGWFACPSRAGMYPAVLILPGYTQALYPPRDWVTGHGMCALALSVRGHEGSRKDSNPGFPGLLVHGIEDKTRYIYRGIFCDAWRGVEVLKILPGVDADKVAVTGLSQGGALALVSAARRKVAAVAADVPFLCGIEHAVEMSNVYPYQEIHDLVRVRPEVHEAVRSTVRYFDVIGFAPEVSCPTLVSVGLRDRKAPPELARLAFDQLAGPKRWVPYQDAGHEGGGWRHNQTKVAWLKEQLT